MRKDGNAGQLQYLSQDTSMIGHEHDWESKSCVNGIRRCNHACDSGIMPVIWHALRACCFGLLWTNKVMRLRVCAWMAYIDLSSTT